MEAKEEEEEKGEVAAAVSVAGSEAMVVVLRKA